MGTYEKTSTYTTAGSSISSSIQCFFAVFRTGALYFFCFAVLLIFPTFPFLFRLIHHPPRLSGIRRRILHAMYIFLVSF